MIYKIDKSKKLGKKNNIDLQLDLGYLLPSRRKHFIIEDVLITNIRIVNKKMANPFVYKVVSKKYLKLINNVTSLLIEDDEDGASCREALNQIERFRSEVKARYRLYLKQEELKEMSKNLKILKQQAKLKEMEMYENIVSYSDRRVR